MLKSVCLKTFNNNHNCIVNRDKKPYILLFRRIPYGFKKINESIFRQLIERKYNGFCHAFYHQAFLSNRWLFRKFCFI
jgi:hypothetical protein